MASTETAQRRYRRPPRSSSSSAGLAPQAVPKSAPSTLKEHAVDDRLHVESNFGITNDAMLQKFEGENLIPHILQSVQTQPLLSDVLTPSTMASPPHGHANLPSSKVHSLSPVVCSDSRLTGPPMSLPAATLTVPKRNILRHLGVIPSTSTSRRPSALLSKASVPTNSQEAAGRTGSEDATRRHLPPLHSGLTDKRVTPARIDISVGALSLGNPVETPSPPLSDDLTTESGSTAQTSPVLSFSRTTSNSSVQSQSKDVSIAQKIEQLAREVDVLRRREQRHPSRNLSCTPVPATGSHHGNVHSGSSAVSSSSGVSSASCQAQRNQELGTRDIQPSSSAHRKAPSQVQHDTASSSEVSQPTAALKPDDFVDQSIPNRNIRARFCSGLEVQLITTPFEPAYLTVTGIPIDLVMTSGNNINQTVKTQERDELRFHSKRRGLGEARPTPQPYQQPGIQVDYVARTKRMMREIFESFGIVTNLEFRYVGESRRSSDDNISSIGKAPRADGAPKPLLREAGGANARYSGRQSVFTVVPPLLMPSNASNASGERVNGRDEASEMRTHTRTNGNVRQGKAQTHDAVGPSRSVGVGNSVKMPPVPRVLQIFLTL
ncbi:hypothetical protein PIIN_09976 [Serendipita indica DSM 11827]|uniref:Uncharacterized protein n=1 Tax=Serendipita indica (strain DSM 11827) TaxID=1109443 RepID=G4TXD3_SERID|nr:hypothetical protein PIIN_09976 [Serendipita indica DSM 11827]